jgi:galactonate dehydratase
MTLLLLLLLERVATPIASCESLFGLREFKPFFENASMDVAIIDIPWNGAWLGLKIAAMEKLTKLIVPHTIFMDIYRA